MTAPSTRPLGVGARRLGPAERGMGMGPPAFAQAIHALLAQHVKIERHVEDIPGGVLAVTTSDDPAVAKLIQVHVNEMKDALTQGRPLRQWDPLFVELFASRARISLDVKTIPGGVWVRETSQDPAVTNLVRRHARAVSEFVTRGWDRAHEPTAVTNGTQGAPPK